MGQINDFYINGTKSLQMQETEINKTSKQKMCTESWNHMRHYSIIYYVYNGNCQNRESKL